MANPIITNVGLVSRNDRAAFKSACVIDGASITADGVLKRGTVLVKNTSGATSKWHAFASGNVLAADGVRILEDDLKVVAGQDGFAAGYLEGFFTLSAIVDANSASGLVAGDLTVAAGFHVIEADEVRLK
jgi:hypothetical protein